jgi:hypothetical protein
LDDVAARSAFQSKDCCSLSYTASQAIRAEAEKLPQSTNAKEQVSDRSVKAMPVTEAGDIRSPDSFAPTKLPQSHVLVPVDVALAAGRKLALIGQIYDGDKESRRLSDELLRAAQEERK